MDMSITFTNHQGKSMVFGAPEGSLHYFENALRNYMYSFDEYNGKAMNFRRAGLVVLFKVGIAADTEEEGEQLREQLYSITNADVEAGKYGTLTIGGYSLNCVIVGQTNSYYRYGDRWLECELSVRIDDPVWRVGTLHTFKIVDDTTVADYLDFPFDFPFDFTPSPKASHIENNSSQLNGSEFIMRIYGPCKNPYVQIAGNSYRVEVTVPTGGYLEIDSAQRTIELVSRYGERTNEYSNRQRGAEGSGSYIFQKVPSGISAVAWNNSFNFDITLFDERSIPPWK